MGGTAAASTAVLFKLFRRGWTSKASLLTSYNAGKQYGGFGKPPDTNTFRLPWHPEAIHEGSDPNSTKGFAALVSRLFPMFSQGRTSSGQGQTGIPRPPDRHRTDPRSTASAPPAVGSQQEGDAGQHCREVEGSVPRPGGSRPLAVRWRVETRGV